MSWLGFGKKGEDKTKPPPPRLRVAIGPDPDHLVHSFVNNPARPTYIDSPNFEARIFVRVKDFIGVCPTESAPSDYSRDPSAKCPTNTPYFEKPGRNRRFSITMQCRFKDDWDAGEIFFGGVFDRRINPPFGTSLMLKAASYIDPSLQSDLDVSLPWVLSSLGCAMNAMIASPLPTNPPPEDNNVAAKPASSPVTPTSADKPPKLPRTGSTRQLPTYPTSSSRVLTPEETYLPSPTLGTWKVPAQDSDIDLVEDTTLLFEDSGYEQAPCSVNDSKARRKWMKESENRHSVMFKKDRVYDMEIYAPFVDLNTHVLNLGLTIDMARYIDGQPITIYLLGHRHPPNLTRGNTLNFMHSISRKKSFSHSRPGSSGVSGPDPKDLPPRKDDEKAKKWWQGVVVFAVVEFALVDGEPTATLKRT